VPTSVIGAWLIWHTGLAMAGKDGDALAAAERIGAVEVRVAALLDLRLNLDGLVAMLAVERATSDIDHLTGDERGPLLASLAAAQAAIGHRARALSIVERFCRPARSVSAGWQRLRWHWLTAEMSTVHCSILAGIVDPDERDWGLDEVARWLAGCGSLGRGARLCLRRLVRCGAAGADTL
jgi:hypothetical protein